jgi:hypothetical protein
MTLPKKEEPPKEEGLELECGHKVDPTESTYYYCKIHKYKKEKKYNHLGDDVEERVEK